MIIIIQNLCILFRISPDLHKIRTEWDVLIKKYWWAFLKEIVIWMQLFWKMQGLRCSRKIILYGSIFELNFYATKWLPSLKKLLYLHFWEKSDHLHWRSSERHSIFWARNKRDQRSFNYELTDNSKSWVECRSNLMSALI